MDEEWGVCSSKFVYVCVVCGLCVRGGYVWGCVGVCVCVWMILFYAEFMKRIYRNLWVNVRRLNDVKRPLGMNINLN